MVNIEYSPILRRKMRKDPLAELGVSSWIRAKEAIEAGRKEEALDLVDVLKTEHDVLHDVYAAWIYHHMTAIADRCGEEEMYRLLMEVGRMVVGGRSKGAAKYSTAELVAINAEGMRCHPCGPGETGSFSITEERDRFVMSFDPCGSGGRLRRGFAEGKKPPLTAPPHNLGRTKKAWPWSWSKAGVPYYCVHCCAWAEIESVEQLGWPFRVTLYEDDPQAPCGWAFYKSPELVPEEYFTRIGVARDPSKFIAPGR